MTSEKNCFDQRQFKKVRFIKSGSWHNKHSLSDSVVQFEVEFFKLVVFANIFKPIKKGV